MMRAFSFILLAGMTLMLLACGLSDGGEEAQEGGTPTVETETPTSMVPPPVELATPTGTAAPPLGLGTASGTAAPPSAAPPLYTGPTSLEERILASPVIARVQLDSANSTVESATAFDGSTKYIALLEFSFSVEEYLKGSGADDIVAVWESRPIYDARQEAEDALPAIAAARDTQWDDREAIVFLKSSQTYLTSTQQTDRYYLTWQHEIDFDDKYSIASRHNKLWLPAAAAVGATSQPTGDQQRFLTDVPPAEGTAPTITLGEIKTLVGTITAKLADDDGSEEYRECVQLTYQYEGDDRRYKERFPSRSGSRFAGDPPPGHEFDAGLAAGSTLYEDDLGFGPTADKLVRFWIDGGDADLFSIEFGDAVPYDLSGDGVNDSVNFNRRVISARSLPESVHRFHFNMRPPFFDLCEGYTIRYEWTVTVNAPVGTLHEAFFDPVTDGSAVAADDSNGVLKPASFADSNGATSTIQRIAWEAGTVSIELSPHTGVAGHAVDFIALDGTVSLSLDVADATVDAANNTLSWPVASRPWRSGDKLMVRIREAP